MGFTTKGTFTSAGLLLLTLCICSVRTLQATPVGGGESMGNSRQARGFFPFGLGAPDHVHFYPEQHHHHHYADYGHTGFPGHHDAHFHLDTAFGHHYQPHHDFHHGGHFDEHYY